MPKMKKYEGTANPQNHVSHYLLMMSPYDLSKDQIALLFIQTLEGPVLEWYHGLSVVVKKD